MAALANGARMGLTAGASVVVFCAVIVAAFGALIAVMEIVNFIMPEGEKNETERKTGD